MKTQTTKTVRISTENVGIHFGTVGVITARNGRVIHTTQVRPYQAHTSALDDARAWADAKGYIVAERRA